MLKNKHLIGIHGHDTDLTIVLYIRLLNRIIIVSSKFQHVILMTTLRKIIACIGNIGNLGSNIHISICS